MTLAAAGCGEEQLVRYRRERKRRLGLTPCFHDDPEILEKDIDGAPGRLGLEVSAVSAA